jgi:hypothetical protein
MIKSHLLLTLLASFFLTAMPFTRATSTTPNWTVYSYPQSDASFELNIDAAVGASASHGDSTHATDATVTRNNGRLSIELHFGLTGAFPQLYLYAVDDHCKTMKIRESRKDGNGIRFQGRAPIPFDTFMLIVVGHELDGYEKTTSIYMISAAPQGCAGCRPVERKC